jgi:general stress protein 26
MDSKLARATVYTFVKDRRLGVIATASNDGTPEAALINIAVTSDIEIVFETASATRKFLNLMRNPRVCLVIGWDNDQTLQVDGLVDAPEGHEYDRLKSFYLSTFVQKTSDQYWPGNS